MRQPGNNVNEGRNRANTINAAKARLKHPDYSSGCFWESIKNLSTSQHTAPTQAVRPLVTPVGQHICGSKPHLTCSWIYFLPVILSWLNNAENFHSTVELPKSLHRANIYNLSLSLVKTNEGHEYPTGGPHQAAVMRGNLDFSLIVKPTIVGSSNFTVLLLVRCIPAVPSAWLQVCTNASCALYTDIARRLCPLPVAVEGTQAWAAAEWGCDK